MATQSKLQKLEVNVGQGSQVLDLSDKELLDYESFIEESNKIEAARLAKIASKESALAKLAGLGLTEEEIAAL